MTPRAIAIVALLVALVGVVWIFWPHPSNATRAILPGTQSTLTEAEEAGDARQAGPGFAAGRSDLLAVPGFRPPTRRTPAGGRTQRSDHVPQARSSPQAERSHLHDSPAPSVPLTLVPPSQSPTVSPPTGGESVQGGTTATLERTPTNGPGPLVPVPAAMPATPPAVVLRPPSLIDGSVGEYPPSTYNVVLDRSTLLPGLQTAAAEGQVMLRLFVLASGRVERVAVSGSSGSEVLDRTAVAAASHWRFAPATRDGEPIAAWVLIPVRFVVK